MALSDHQQKIRHKSIGASDASVILGLSPYKSAYDLYLEKTQAIEPDYVSGNAATRFGSLAEGILIDHAASTLGVRVRKNQRRVRGIHSAQHDALISDKPEGMEAKTAGVFNRFFDDSEWGEDGSGDIPVCYKVQAYQQMYVSDLERVFVPALIAGRTDLQIFEVERNDKLVDALIQKTQDWWDRYVEGDEIHPVEVSRSTIGLLSKMFRSGDQGDAVPVNNALMDEFIAAKLLIKETDQRASQLKAQMIVEMGDSVWGNAGSHLASFKKQNSNRIDLGMLRENYPEVAEECTVTSTSTVFRTKKNPDHKGD